MNFSNLISKLDENLKRSYEGAVPGLLPEDEQRERLVEALEAQANPVGLSTKIRPSLRTPDLAPGPVSAMEETLLPLKAPTQKQLQHETMKKGRQLYKDEVNKASRFQKLKKLFGEE